MEGVDVIKVQPLTVAFRLRNSLTAEELALHKHLREYHQP
jgi:hypothetical protein